MISVHDTIIIFEHLESLLIYHRDKHDKLIISIEHSDLLLISH
jgi:hypothetical protein